MTSRQKQLCFSLEKAHLNTVGFGYEQRAREQDAYLKEAFASTKNKSESILALLYCLSCMHDDTYAVLMEKNVLRSKFELINEFIIQLTTFSVAKNKIPSSVKELSTFEIERVAAKHTTSATTMDADAHEAKNFRFIIELDALLNMPDLKQCFSEVSAQSSCDSRSLVDADNFHEELRNPNEAVTETDTSSDIVYRRAVNLGSYWKFFLTSLEASTVTPAALMTTTLITFSQLSHNIKPLLDWEKALAEYCQNPYGLLSEASKAPARKELGKIQAWCADKTIAAPTVSELTGSGMNMYRSASSGACQSSALVLSINSK